MNTMSDGLRTAAGTGLRTLLAKASAKRFAGLALGPLLGFLVHSAAAAVILVGFINADFINLARVVTPAFGANPGTSLSMPLVSFHLADFCHVGLVGGDASQPRHPRPLQ